MRSVDTQRWSGGLRRQLESNTAKTLEDVSNRVVPTRTIVLPARQLVEVTTHTHRKFGKWIFEILFETIPELSRSKSPLCNGGIRRLKTYRSPPKLYFQDREQFQRVDRHPPRNTVFGGILGSVNLQKYSLLLTSLRGKPIRWRSNFRLSTV